MAKMKDLFGEEPRLHFHQLDTTTLSPDTIWADYDAETDSVLLYFTGQPVSATSVYIGDDFYAMVDPKSNHVVGILVEALEQRFLQKHALLQASWPYVKQTLSDEVSANSLLQLFAFGLAFLVGQGDEKALQPA